VKTKAPIHGLMAEFADHEQLVTAARRASQSGYCRMDAYTPFPVQGLAEALGQKRSAVPRIVLLGGLGGGLGGYFMQWYAMAFDYPMNIGGRPFHSWPAFIPITFELTVLAAALSAMVGMLVLNRLPRPHHPVFNVSEFARASTDRFFLCIESGDPRFEAAATRQFLESLNPASVKEVPS
jgi:hypothetical protein